MTIQLLDILKADAQAIADREPLLSQYMHTSILSHITLASCFSFILAEKLADHGMPVTTLRTLFESICEDDPELLGFASHDAEAVVLRDPTTDSYVPVLVNQKGFQSIQAHRFSHYLWNAGRKDLAAFIQSRNAQVFGVDIHPACKIGKGVRFNHATGIVIGETCVIGDDVSIMQGVTLGSTDDAIGERHPKIGNGVLIGAGAIILGNILIGEGARIGAGSVVLTSVPPNATVVGVLARTIVRSKNKNASEMTKERRVAQRLATAQ
jgi:serine O-acetyltransferase